MRHSRLLALLGLLLIVLGVIEQGWTLISGWLGFDFLALAIAHIRGAHRVFGKHPSGTLSFYRWLLFLPLHVYTGLIWHLHRLLSREPSHNVVSEQLIVGRRLLASELAEKVDNYIDLTAEFAELSAIRDSPAYFSFPILDSAAPSPEALLSAVSSLRPGSIFVHCAQGHGRTGLFALAVLLRSGKVHTVDDGLRTLQAARPAIRLSKAQLDCVQAFAKLL